MEKEFKFTSKDYENILDNINTLYKHQVSFVEDLKDLTGSMIGIVDQLKTVMLDVQKIEENLGMVKPKPMTEQERNKYIAEHLEEHPEWKYEK